MQRRTFLRGLGATISLPAMSSLAAPTKLGSSAAAAPLRMAFLYVPNGVNLDHWKPNVSQGAGKDFKLASSLTSLNPYREDLQIIGGLDHDKAKANGDGPGDHARASATFLTGCQAKKTAGANIRNGVSVDQLAATHIGHNTKLSSLELSTVRARMSGSCDSGYSCIYQHNISWRDENTPMPAEYNPRTAFEKLFGSGNAEQDAARRAQRKSVLDFVSDQSKKLSDKASKRDQEKLDEYLTSIREVEARIEKAEKMGNQYPEEAIPSGVPRGYQSHIRSMFDIMALAFKTDSTRVASFMLSNEGSNRSFQNIGVSEGHHSLSHHRKNPSKLKDIAKIDTFYAQQLAYFLEQLKASQLSDQGEEMGSILDNTMILYGSAIGDGNAHNHTDLPIILAGGAKHGIQTGRHVIAPDGTPVTNLYLSMLDKMNVNAKRIGDSTGKFSI